MKHLKLTAALLAGVIALSGCSTTSDEDSSYSLEITSNPAISDVPPEPPKPPASLTSLDEVIIKSPVGNIEVPSVEQALKRFDEISAKTPKGTPEEIVKTLMERNVLCFALMHGKCWEQDGEGYGVRYDTTEPRYIPIQSDYIKGTDQLEELFGGTYTETETSHLLHPFDVYNYTDTFFYKNGDLYYDLDYFREFHKNSFSEPTRAVIVSATDNKIVFGRLSAEHPVGDQPNNFLFEAVNNNGQWRLTTFVTDAPAYSPMYDELITTNRAGNTEIMKLVETQVGYVGGMKYCTWYGLESRTEWCAAFVSWAYSSVDADAPAFLRCNSEGRRWFTEHGQWRERGYGDIAPGDSIFFDWDLDDSADHVGLVVGRDENYVYTVEGNRSDTCIANKYELDNMYILGYGLVNWN